MTNAPRHPDHVRFAERAATVTDVYHRLECRHQVEIEVWPARVELNFGDEWTANPISTQTRFEAIVYNSSQGHLWEVRSVDGSPGLGTIDASGVYRSPPKGALPNAFTEIVVATSREDRLRKAYAWVTLVGVGAMPAPAPTVEIWPKQLTLYYRQGANNSYIDDCNKMRLFEATPRDAAAPAVEWLVGGVLQSGTSQTFLYQSPNSGGTAVVTVRARLQAQPAIFDDAKVLQLNYTWPGA
jgi:hypothetical protein